MNDETRTAVRLLTGLEKGSLFSEKEAENVLKGLSPEEITRLTQKAREVDLPAAFARILRRDFLLALKQDSGDAFIAHCLMLYDPKYDLSSADGVSHLVHDVACYQDRDATKALNDLMEEYCGIE